MPDWLSIEGFTTDVMDQIDASLNILKTYSDVQLNTDLTNADAYLKNYISSSPRNETFLTSFETIRNKINGKIAEMEKINKILTDKVSNAELANNTNKLSDIGIFQQQIKSLKEKVNKLSDELSIAESRESSIKTRKSESSYAQTFGYLFRPFRRISYPIIVILIFILILVCIWLVYEIINAKPLNISSATSMITNSKLNTNIQKLFKS
jgi:hypothetical protein